MTDITLLPSVVDFLKQSHGQYINGQHVKTSSSKSLEVFNPATGEIIAHVHKATDAEIDAAVQAAHTAFHSTWADTSPMQRGDYLYKLAELLQRDREILAQIESLSSGKIIQLSRFLEIDQSTQFLKYFAGWSSKISGETLNVSLPSFNKEKYSAFTLREPVGVVAGIIPWNFSIMIAIWKLAAALTCGCTIVLKPSEYTPLTLLKLVDLAKEAGIPDGVINIVNGDGKEVGTRLITHKLVSKVSFTGSVATGLIVGEQAMHSNLKRTTLELGGKNGAAFLTDVSVETIVNGIIEAGFLNQGQICAAAERFYIPNDLLPEVMDKLAVALGSMKIGSSLDETTQVGPLANKMQKEKVLSLIEKAKSEGNKIICGGHAIEGAGYFVAPTAILANSTQDTLMKEETFGPVGTLIGYDNENELINMLNDSPYGLSASLWTNDLSKAYRMIPKIEAGTLWVNMHTFLDPALPFGGVKASGIGREFGSAFIEYYTELKSVMIRY
ncbi:aldehyde dehydrogenase family protein [Thorsellia kenyensis]|uniref:Aldehyde dehydrogenase family protein n=1 Tax=Thorsellia kenyensis TaxID=1549888 RepID=A0ABV6CCZ6_9GAMM